MPKEQTLRSWLRRNPPPVRIRCHTDDGIKVIAVDRESSRKWSDAEDNIASMKPTRVECLNAKNEIIRGKALEYATEPGAVSDEEAAETTEDVARKSKYGIRATRDVQLARIISDAYAKGAQLNNEANALATARLFDLVNLMSSRLTSMEVAWQGAMTQVGQFRAAMGNAESEGALAELIPMLLKAAMGNGAAALPAAKTNGTPPPKG
jgi:hypothetical protein